MDDKCFYSEDYVPALHRETRQTILCNSLQYHFIILLIYCSNTATNPMTSSHEPVMYLAWTECCQVSHCCWEAWSRTYVLCFWCAQHFLVFVSIFSTEKFHKHLLTWLLVLCVASTSLAEGWQCPSHAFPSQSLRLFVLPLLPVYCLPSVRNRSIVHCSIQDSPRNMVWQKKSSCLGAHDNCCLQLLLIILTTQLASLFPISWLG